MISLHKENLASFFSETTPRNFSQIMKHIKKLIALVYNFRSNFVYPSLMRRLEIAWHFSHFHWSVMRLELTLASKEGKRRLV